MRYRMNALQNLVLFDLLSPCRRFKFYHEISTISEALSRIRLSRSLNDGLNFMKSAPCYLHISAENVEVRPLTLYQSLVEVQKASEFSMLRHEYAYDEDVSEANCIISRLCAKGKISEAREVFEVMPERNVISWTAMISGYMKHGLFNEARELFDRTDAQKDVVTWTAMISGYMKRKKISEAEKVFEEMPDKNLTAWNTMIIGYVRNGRIEEALTMFERMGEKDVVSWNTVISGLVNCGRIEEASALFYGMPVHNVISWNTMISGLARSGRVEEARMLFNSMPERSVVSWNAMISCFIQNGELEAAVRLFDEMPKKDVVSWTAIIGGFVQYGKSEEALKTFGFMNRYSRIKPNEGTFVSVLGACSDLAGLVEGVQVHQVISKTVYHESEFVISALISMYSKCGVLAMARKVFDDGLRGKRDLVCWNSMISGYAHHGCGREAIMVFEEMRNMGLKPNGVTYIGLLSACSHAGLVQEGLNYFEALTKDESIEVREGHYTCVVALYGRAGRLEEAFDLVKRLPMKASVNTWCVLLLGCYIHGNDYIGKQVENQLLDVEAANAGTYSLLSNLYVVRKRPQEAELLKMKMKDEGLKRQPGCSWIEVENRFHVFIAGEKCHREFDAIRDLIFGLDKKMKKIGVMTFDDVSMEGSFF